jgi:hypothetical protein
VTHQALQALVAQHYRGLEGALDAMLAVFGSMSLAGRTKPLSLMFETASGYGKTAVVQMAFPLSNLTLERYVYRSDRFTPKAFVSHAATVARAKLSAVDLLPRVVNKVLLTKELAPIFRGREEDLKETFSTLISVLDGKGYVSDSGTHGHRGYPGPVLFNWIGATTPLPASTHRLMSQLGTRLLFYEVPAIAPSDDELLAYAQNDQASAAEQECQQAMNEFLLDFFATHPIQSVPAESIVFPGDRMRELVQWAQFTAAGRAEVTFERDGSNWAPVGAMPPEGPWKLVNYLKDLARGRALIHGRSEIDACDLGLIGHVAISSIPGYLRPIVRKLRDAASVDTATAESLCRVSAPTARNYLKQLELLGIVKVAKGSPEDNQPDAAELAPPYRWLRGTLKSKCGVKGGRGRKRGRPVLNTGDV